MDADDLDPQFARPLDEGDADLRVIEPIAHALRPPLGVGLPGRDAVLFFLPRHLLDRPREVRVDEAMDEEPVAPTVLFFTEGLDELLRRRGVGGRERVVLGRGRHGRQDRHIGVAVEEDLADEVLGREALDGAVPAVRLGKGAQDIGPLVGDAPPRALGVHVMALDVEDEFLARERLARRLGLVRRVAPHIEISAAQSGPGVRLVHRHERQGGARQRLQERPAGHPEPPGRLARPFVGERLGKPDAVRERTRQELAVRGRIELDRQAPAFGVEALVHGTIIDPGGAEIPRSTAPIRDVSRLG